jgi:hypothetical protein
MAGEGPEVGDGSTCQADRRRGGRWERHRGVILGLSGPAGSKHFFRAGLQLVGGWKS